MAIRAIYYGGNTWLLEIEGKKIIIDPWLRGDLIFPPGDWLIKGKLKKLYKLPIGIDLILLTQGLSDHAHEETLRLFDRTIPIIASATAVKLIKKIGFQKIISLKPKMSSNILNLEIIATKGALVPTIENGYIIRSPNSSIYIEPHGYFDENIVDEKINIVISPVVNIGLPLVGSFILGKDVIPKIIKKLNPDYILSSTVGGEIEFTGLLGKYIKQEGSFEEVQNNQSRNISWINPIPGKIYEFRS